VRNSNVKLGISEITLTYEIGKVFLGYSKGKKDIEFKVSAKSIFLGDTALSASWRKHKRRLSSCNVDQTI
jgi:hypothetical protein